MIFTHYYSILTAVVVEKSSNFANSRSPMCPEETRLLIAKTEGTCQSNSEYSVLFAWTFPTE